jgi:hypothetical protein
MVFYVRRHTGADGSFEWYVLNGHTRRRASNFLSDESGGCSGAGEVAVKLDLASESPPAIAGRLRFARCSDRRSEGDRRGWFDEAGLPAAPNTRSERPRHVRQALFRTSFCRIGFGVGIPTKGRKRKRRRSGAKLGGGALPTNVRAQPMRVNQGDGHRKPAASHTLRRGVGLPAGTLRRGCDHSAKGPASPLNQRGG